MGRTSKLSRKFDMVLFVIFTMGIFVIILSVGAEYSWDWWITVISFVALLFIVWAMMGTGYYYKILNIKKKTVSYKNVRLRMDTLLFVIQSVQLLSQNLKISKWMKFDKSFLKFRI